MQKCAALILALACVAGFAGESAVLPPAVEKSFRSQWNDFEIVSVKDKKDRFEVKAIGADKKEFKSGFATDGTVRFFEEHALAFEQLPEAVRKSAKTWSTQAKWYPMQKAFKNDGDPAVYVLTGEINGARFVTRFAPDGTNLNDTKNKDRGSKKSDSSLTRCC